MIVIKNFQWPGQLANDLGPLVELQNVTCHDTGASETSQIAELLL